MHCRSSGSAEPIRTPAIRSISSPASASTPGSCSNSTEMQISEEQKSASSPAAGAASPPNHPGALLSRGAVNAGNEANRGPSNYGHVTGLHPLEVAIDGIGFLTRIGKDRALDVRLDLTRHMRSSIVVWTSKDPTLGAVWRRSCRLWSLMSTHLDHNALRARSHSPCVFLVQEEEKGSLI